jgi:copper homeostasis protein
VQSCVIAERVGAHRVEFCDNPLEGGTTASYGAIRLAREKINIKLYPIIRPKSGNYLYDDDDFEIIRKDIEMVKQLGCDGISVGVQTIGGEIDTKRLSRIVEWAYPMGVNCNRVFDAAPDPFKALDDIIACGCERVLTSGQQSDALQGSPLLAKLVQQAGDRITIMPGAGVRSSNIAALIKETGATEYHTSARITVPNSMRFYNKNILDAGNVYMADENELKKIIRLLNES